MNTAEKPFVLAIAGPTATGKTGLAVKLAQRLDGEIVSCDSMQIYAGMRIGTAAPNQAERGGVPHHLIGVLPPTEPFSVADYCRLATDCIADIVRRGRLPIVAGGTGLYMDSLLRGTSFAQLPEGGELRLALQQLPGDRLYARLMREDPVWAAKLHVNDRKRVIRALEVCLAGGKPMSQLAAEALGQSPYRVLWIGLDCERRELLYDRINRRVDAMMEQGLVEEVRQLLALPGIEGSTALQAIGYKELAAAVRGEIPLGEAAERVKQATRRYAKRQRTWFARNGEMQRFYIDRQDESEILSDILKLTKNSNNN